MTVLLKMPAALLLAGLLFIVQEVRGLEPVPDSWSPDGRRRIAVEMNGEQPQYRVVTRGHSRLPGSFESDYWQVDQCLASTVRWRRDGAYFVIEEPSTRFHQGFAIGRRTARGYQALPFDRQTVMRDSKLSWHLASVSFQRWLPGDRVQIEISGDLDEGREFACQFILDLKHPLRVLSCDVLQPK